MNIQLQDHGYPGNLSIPITINIDLSGTIKPGTPKPNPTPTQPAINPTPTEPATNPPPTKPATKRPTDSDKGSGKTSEPALSLYGDSIAAFLNSESGKAFAQMAGIDRSFSEPPLNAYKREEIDKAIKNIAQEAATDLTCGLIERLILELTDGGVEAPDDGPTSPETSPPGPKEPPTDNVDTQNPDGPDPVITKPKISTPSEELTEYLTKYIHDNLAEFYLLGASDHRVEQMIVRAEELTKQLTEKFKVPAELVPKLATIGLYEIVVLLGTYRYMSRDIHNSTISFPSSPSCIS